MPIIKIHLERAEYNALARRADVIHATPEAVAYDAISRVMLDTHGPELSGEVAHVWEAHHEHLPLWSDFADGLRDR